MQLQREAPRACSQARRSSMQSTWLFRPRSARKGPASCASSHATASRRDDSSSGAKLVSMAVLKRSSGIVTTDGVEHAGRLLLALDLHGHAYHALDGSGLDLLHL